MKQNLGTTATKKSNSLPHKKLKQGYKDPSISINWDEVQSLYFAPNAKIPSYIMQVFMQHIEIRIMVKGSTQADVKMTRMWLQKFRKLIQASSFYLIAPQI